MSDQDKRIADLARSYCRTLTEIRTILAAGDSIPASLWDQSQIASDALRVAVEKENA